MVEGFTARLTTFHDLPLIAGEPYYTLPDTVVDVIEDAMFVPNDNADTKHATGEGVASFQSEAKDAADRRSGR